MENQDKKLDLKDYKILRELDTNFRQSFSEIGKKVGLSKNSVSLRFEKLKPYMLHNITGLDNEILGCTMVKVFYTFDFLNEKTEKEIANELKKHKNILWAARFYGSYDLCICLFVNNMDDLINQVSSFDKRFSNKINKKEIQIIFKQTFFRNNFVHEKPILKKYEIKKTDKKVKLINIEKRILLELRYNPRISLINLSEKTGLYPKTISNRIKSLEKNGVIMGYFMTLDPIKFNFNSFKLLFQVQNLKEDDKFESYLSSIKNIKYITKMLGLWDYELDCVYSTTMDLQKQIEEIKEKFPNVLKKIAILNFGKRIATNKENFLR